MRNYIALHAKLLCYTIMFTTFSACNMPKAAFKILERHIMQGVPSASGIASIGDSLFVIGDNTPWIYRINQDFEIASKLRLEDFGLADGEIIAKPAKPDFEAIEVIEIAGRKKLFVFGSGSKSPSRDVLVQVDYEAGVVDTHSLKAVYAQLKSSAPLQGYELNIEGVAVAGDHLFLLNRGKNIVFQYSFSAFYDFVINKSPECPEPKAFEIILPKIRDRQSGFSGATMLPDGSSLLFTASVETNPNAIDDGKVLGSFIGAIPLKALKNKYKPACVQISEGDENLKIKVESVVVLDLSANGNATVLLVTDSDGGASEILKGVFFLRR